MKTLYYILDPMCSWCYAFAPVWQKLLKNLDSDVHVEYVYGGLAPHSDEPMSKSMQEMLENTWKAIEKKVGTQFNYDFWKKCKPRRSTYLACQACISAKEQGKEYEMIKEIQKAYYKNASNPSDRDTLERAALNAKLNVKQFSSDLESQKTITLLEKNLNRRRALGVNGFPSLILKSDNQYYNIDIDFTDYKNILKNLKK